LQGREDSSGCVGEGPETLARVSRWAQEGPAPNTHRGSRRGPAGTAGSTCRCRCQRRP